MTTNAIYTYSLQLVNNNLLTLGNGDTGDFKLKTIDLQTKKDIYSIPLIPIDFDYNENQSIIVANYKNLTLVKADKLSSILFNIGKDKLYPNPTNQNLTIPKSYFTENFLYYNIIDMTGKEIYKHDTFNQFNEDMTLDVSRFVKGSYIVQFFYENSSMPVGVKFIKDF